MHRDLVQEHGGALGVRDESLIESALARPQHRWSYARRDVGLPVLAAAYAFGLAKIHGFVDGNKRIALLAAYTFLLINGLELEVSELQAVDIMVATARGKLSEHELAAWIRQNVVPFKGELDTLD